MSSSRPKTKPQDATGFDLLHSGVRRCLSPQEYTKLFTKIRIGQPKRQSFLPCTDRAPLEDYHAENARLRQKIRQLEGENASISSLVSKQYKLEGLLGKRIVSQDLSAISIDKAMEIKLIIEADALQQHLREKECLLDATIRSHREREEWSKTYNNLGQSELYAILLDNQTLIADKLREKEKKVELQQQKMVKMREKSQKIRQIKRVKGQELKQIEKQVKRGKENLPNVNKISDQNDSGIYGTQIRAKTTENLQMEIQKLKSQRSVFEKKIQQLIQQKVKQKIQILKVIDQFQNLSLGHRQRVLF